MPQSMERIVEQSTGVECDEYTVHIYLEGGTYYIQLKKWEGGLVPISNMEY